MTCFLEYTTATAVLVHDLIYTRDPGGDTWVLARSSYPKLRMAPAQVAAELSSAGLIPAPPAMAGRLALVVAHKPARAD